MKAWFGYLQSASSVDGLSSHANMMRLSHIPAVLVRSETKPNLGMGIAEFVEVPQAIGETVVALDTFVAIEAKNSASSFVNGWPAEDVGYPSIDLEKGTRNITFDRTVQYPTRAPVIAAVNMSFGPADPFTPFMELDPINFATSFVARSVLPVFAAGNVGSTTPARETMSAWAEAPWVLAVGATADEAGRQLADYSSVGIPGIPDSGPDLVSFGESELDYKVVGTSFAAPRIARSAAILTSALLTVRHYVQRHLGQPVEGIPAVGVAYIDERIYPVDKTLQLRGLPAAGVSNDSLATVLRKLTNQGRQIDIRVAPNVLRQLLGWAARPMSKYGPHQVGLGFVNYDTVESFLHQFSAAHFAWLFARPQPSTSELEEIAGIPLFLPDAIAPMVDLWRRATLRWAWDYRDKRFLDADGSTWEPITAR